MCDLRGHDGTFLTSAHPLQTGLVVLTHTVRSRWNQACGCLLHVKELCNAQLLFLIIIIRMPAKEQTALGGAYGEYLLNEIR